MAVRAWDVGRSECRAVMVRIRVSTSPDPKGGLRPTGLSSQETLANRWQAERQMTSCGVPTAWCIRPVFALGRARLALHRKARTTTATAYCEGRREGSETGSGNGLLKGLSGVRGNFHAPFLGGRAQQCAPPTRQYTQYAKARGFTIADEFVDHESGTKETRPELDKLWQVVRARDVDVVLVWRFDRFSRSTKQLINALSEFENLGVDFISKTDQIDTTSPAGRALFTMVSAFAQFERDIISERVKSGIDRARAQG